MGKVLYSATMSLDGYIAGPDGDMSWLAPFFGPNRELDDLPNHVGALLIGNRTFRGDDPNRGTDSEGAFGGTWDGPSFVLTHHAPATAEPGVTFVDDLASGLTAAKTAAGDDYVNVLGADVARQCADAGELDEVLAVIVPILLGGGTRLFESPGGKTVNLKQLSLTAAPPATNLWMRVIR